MTTVVMHKSNLEMALHETIKARREWEKSQGYTGDSGFTAGLAEVLKQIQDARDAVFVQLVE